MPKNNKKNKKVIIISIIISIAILVIGITLCFLLKPKTNEELSYGINELYESLKQEKSYSFNLTLDSNNKSFYAKQSNNAYLDDIVDKVETEMLIQNGNTYLIKDEDKAYYVYKNNESNLNKIEDILQDLKNVEHEIGKEKIDDKNYSYIEFNQLTDFAIMNTSNIKSSTKKTRFYFDGKNLEYIKTIAGNKEELLKVTITKDVDNKLFQIPSNYEEK